MFARAPFARPITVHAVPRTGGLWWRAPARWRTGLWEPPNRRPDGFAARTGNRRSRRRRSRSV